MKFFTKQFASKIDYANSSFYFDTTFQDVSFCIYLIEKRNYKRDSFIKIKSISSGNVAFLSLLYEEGICIIDNRIISKGNIIELKYDQTKPIKIGITSIDEWLSEQRILTNDTNFGKLIQSKIMSKTSDIKLIVKSEEKNETINCHSNYLCIKSPYFFNMLELEFAESESGEADTYCSKEAMMPILQYIYTGKIDKSFFVNDNYGSIVEMYSKICEYQITEVKDIVEIFILAFLNESNLKLLLQSTILNQDDPFSKTAINFIANYLTDYNQLN